MTKIKWPVRMVWEGDPRTKKNSQELISVKTKDGGSRAVLLPSKAFRIYERMALLQIPERMRLMIDRRVNVQAIYYMETHRIVDLPNLLEATDDILVGGKVVVDDNVNIIATHDGSRVRYDKERPRVEIEITPMEDE